MLKPDERTHLLDLLRPPPGCQLDFAVGTTYSLDLISALMVPLSFAFFDWEHPDGALVADPLALLEALRRFGDCYTVFCQSGQIRLPAKYSPLVTFLEPCIYGVQPEDPQGVFHPKVWVLRFVSENEAVFYRVLCQSRNLTFDRCWDTVVALDGELTDRTNAIAANRPLADFINALPSLSERPVPLKRRQRISNVADELLRVRFTWPEGFDGPQCRFWVAGLDGRTVRPFEARRSKALIVSPFLSNGVIDDFLAQTDEVHLISRQESLQELPQETLHRCASVRVLAQELVAESDEEIGTGAEEEVLDGLHAKLFVVDRGWDASLFSGSFNATGHAMQHNVEFMVELVGKKSRFGVDQFLRQVKGETNFADLFQSYDLSAPSLRPNQTAKQLDQLICNAKKALAAASPKLIVKSSVDADLFDLCLAWKKAPYLPDPGVTARAWPITQPAERAQTLGKAIVFPRLSHAGLTSLIAFSVSASIDQVSQETVFVMNLPLDGAPEDRQDRIIRSLIESSDQLLRYILFLLSSGDEAAASSGNLRRLLNLDAGSVGRNLPHPYLLETMLRALHRGPAQFDRVASLLDVLRKGSKSPELLGQGFQQIWEPIWDAAQQAMSK
jgi:hypothetical protein